MISIGTLNRPSLQDAQESTFASHASVRSFYRITELNDTEKNCHKELNISHMRQIVDFCRGRRGNVSQHLHIKEAALSIKSLKIYKKQSNPPAWMCAQKRFVDGFKLVIDKYKRDVVLPDYLFLIDDDTYLNINVLVTMLPNLYPAHEAHVVAGCRLRLMNGLGNFTNYALGGLGTFYTRAALENLIKPLHCSNNNNTNDDPIVQNACERVGKNMIGEKPLFHDGMAMVDLMHAYSTDQPYLQVHQWNRVGFCMHSDIYFGYFIKFYPIVRPVNDDPPEALKAFNHSSEQDRGEERRGHCHGDKVCTMDSFICHHQKETDMHTLHLAQVHSTLPGWGTSTQVSGTSTSSA